MPRSSTILLFTLLLQGCPSTEEPHKPVSQDSGGTDADTALETSTPDTPVDVGCTLGAIDKRACGKCGQQQRVCKAAGWGDFGACEDEIATAECALTDTRSNPCGNCGTQKDTCDPKTCTWLVGSCAGEGACAPGSMEKSPASCTAPEVRTRTCDDKCAWSAFSACGLPKGWSALPSAPTTLKGRYGHAAVWTGSEMIVWGGTLVSGGAPAAADDGASYDPSSGKWTSLPAAPSPITAGRSFPAYAYGGGTMIVWGGGDGTSLTVKGDGARWDTSAKKWVSMSSSGAPTARLFSGAVWSTTTNEMIVWGGCTGLDTSLACSGHASDGAAYDPAKDTWTALPAPPSGFAARAGHVMMWSGSELLVWGGSDTTTDFKDGARYDPATKTWTTMTAVPTGFEGRGASVAVWSGSEMLVFSGFISSSKTILESGARYKPGGSWSLLSAPGTALPSAKRYLAAGWFGGGKLWVWSGIGDLGKMSTNGASWDPALDKWAAMDTTDAPAPRGYASVIWTGKEALVWGGVKLDPSPGALADGAMFRP